MKAKYVNPFTDFGFKKIFGEEASKPQLTDFLNSLLLENQIIDLEFKDKEKNGTIENDRKAVYDIYCETQTGEKIIVELQKAKQNFFKDRTVYYASFPIQEQAEKGDWNYQLKAVYCVGILDFKFDEDKESKGEVIHTVQLKDQKNEVFYKKLKFVYLEMPHFHKTENELETRLDKWLYFIKNLENLENIPGIFKDEIFEKAFEKAKLSNYTHEERIEYENNLKIYRDYKNTMDTAYDEGKFEGEIIGLEKGEIIGLEKGEIIGLEKGEIIGLEKEKKKGIIKALQRGKLTIEEIADDFEVSVEYVLEIKKLLDK
jgi:predicted transposase/invertase (TIGR01784 family)